MRACQGLLQQISARWMLITLLLLQMLANTKAMWYIAADKGSVAQVQSQDASVASIPAVYLPETLWQQQHRTRSSSPSARDMQPSALWIGGFAAGHLCNSCDDALPSCVHNINLLANNTFHCGAWISMSAAL